MRERWRRLSNSLSFRLFAITIAVILVVELIIFVPSATQHRNRWLVERVQAARIAALALDATPSGEVSDQLALELLGRADVLNVAQFGDEGIRQQLVRAPLQIEGEVKTVDLRQHNFLGRTWATIETMFGPAGRNLRILDNGYSTGDDGAWELVQSRDQSATIEVLVEEQPLRRELFGYLARVALLSLIVSLAAAGFVFAVMLHLVIRPVRRLTASVVQFRQDPGGWTRRLQPTDRRDEIGRAENALADMEMAVSDAFRQRERLALLGESMAKISHDLRNSLATAQLVSDNLSSSEDPRVQRSAPRLERALERAISLAQQTLQYGRNDRPAAAIAEIELHQAVEEAAFEGLAGREAVNWTNEIPIDAVAQADPDHLHRIVTNLIRNAAQALEQHDAPERRIGARLTTEGVEISDTGPGLPAKIQESLFKPFAGTTKRDGSGLGLAIARELGRAMGGDVSLARTSAEGTAFLVAIPVTTTGEAAA